MSSVNYRGFKWLDDSADHPEEDELRATALAKRWSEIHHEQEQQRFMEMADVEDGRSHEPDLDECDLCGGTGIGACGIVDDFEHVRCDNPECEDGYIVTPLREMEKRRKQARVEQDLEVEIIEEKLLRIGAAMMRPYEHWNEDEALMARLEGESMYG